MLQHSRVSLLLILALLQLEFFHCVLILQEICEGENRKKKKKSNSKPYDFYFYNLSKESEGRCSMDRQICVFGVNPAKRPDLMIFNAAVTLLTFTAPDVYLLK